MMQLRPPALPHARPALCSAALLYLPAVLHTTRVSRLRASMRSAVHACRLRRCLLRSERVSCAQASEVEGRLRSIAILVLRFLPLSMALSKNRSGVRRARAHSWGVRVPGPRAHSRRPPGRVQPPPRCVSALPLGPSLLPCPRSHYSGASSKAACGVSTTGFSLVWRASEALLSAFGRGSAAAGPGAVDVPPLRIAAPLTDYLAVARSARRFAAALRLAVRKAETLAAAAAALVDGNMSASARHMCTWGSPSDFSPKSMRFDEEVGAARLTSLLMDPRCVRLTDAPFLATTENHSRGTPRWGCGRDLRPRSLHPNLSFALALSLWRLPENTSSSQTNASFWLFELGQENELIFAREGAFLLGGLVAQKTGFCAAKPGKKRVLRSKPRLLCSPRGD